MLVSAKILERLHTAKQINPSDTKFINSKIRFIRRSFKRFTDSRNLIAPSNLTGFVLYIHKGNKYKRLRLAQSHVGFKLGEFSFTRKPFKYPIKKKKKNFIRR
jgi:ribosomal protein S19